ncbi:MAG: alpha-L-rhamnosidase [Bacteroidetes bacterium]|nr:MAG: alpha-L-rhamnosidase [Bacteroidota bacterium]
MPSFTLACPGLARLPLLLASLLIAIPVAASGTAAPATVAALRCEYQTNPLGLDARRPRLSWQLRATARDVMQTAYQIQVAGSKADLEQGRNLLWDTGEVTSDQSVHVPYAGPPLQSGQRYWWRVRVWTGDDIPSTWSEPAFWEMGLLEPSDWQAQWIEPDVEEDVSTSAPAPMLRRTFRVEGEVVRARAYVTSHGLYELHLNGRRVGDQVFTPGWTSYHHQLQVQTYDVTDLLQDGPNAVGAILGDGWYRGQIGFRGQRNFYGNRLALLAQLVITYADGRTEVIGTDSHWRATNDGPIRMSDIYNGEVYDARREFPGWSTTGFDDSGWAGVRIADHGTDHLVAPAGPPVRRVEEIRPIALLTSPAGETIIDMGQNMVGWVRLRVSGPAGTTITLRHAEVLDQEGNLYTENLRAARQTVQYTLRGDGEEIYEPHFTFQGFRYVAVEGFPGTPTLDAFTGIVIHSDMAQTGHFRTSNPLVNQLQHNIRWGQKGNFLDVPTDCPQRDERLGWTGDAQVFCRTAAFNYDVAGFFTKWLADLAFDQYDSGSIPHVIPNVLATDGQGAAGAAGWADAGVLIPWDLYLVYGDRLLLERQYPGMTAWVGYMQRRAGDDLIWDGDPHFGDWLAFNTTRSDYPGATTSKDFIATAFYAYSAALTARAADVLGKPEDAAHYRRLSERIKQAFRQEFVTPNGRVGENTQTAYALALAFDLLPEALRQQAADRLAEDVRRFGHLTTGFLGTPHLNHVLTRFGYTDLAYALLLRETYPSWLYPVTQGATTIWERWDGLRPDGSFQDPGMNSFNHYAYGAVGDWMYRVMAGLDTDPERPGYKHVLIAPRPGGGFTEVEARLETLYGTTGSAWTWHDDTFSLTVTVPPNTTATVRLPGAAPDQVQVDGRPLVGADGVHDAGADGTDTVVQIGSGMYRFSYPMVSDE